MEKIVSAPFRAKRLSAAACGGRRSRFKIVAPMILFGAVALAAGEASAQALALFASDGAGTSSFTNPLTGAAAGWGPTRVAPVAGSTYTVGAFFLRSPADNVAHTFPGDSLTINTGGTMLNKSTGTAQLLTVNNFILNGGAIRQATVAGDGLASTMAGNISVTAASTMGALGAAAGQTTGVETLTISATIRGIGPLTLNSTTVGTGTDNGIIVFASANPTYSGALTLNSGTLRGAADFSLGTGNVTLGNVTGTNLTLSGGATNNYLGDTAVLTLGALSRLNLNYTGTDQVAGLVVGGTSLAPGTYDATTPATQAFFTGTGSITVVPEPASLVFCALGGLAVLARLAKRRQA